MSFWQRTKQIFGGLAKKSRVFRSILHRTGMMRGFEKGSWTEYAKDGPEKNPYVASVIDNIQTSCASIPPRLYRITGGGETASVQSGYERKAHSGHFGRQKKRRAALTVIRNETKRIREETGLSMVKSKERAMKALLEQGELELVEGHELIALLDRPNPWYQKSYASFIKAIVGGLELGGESYIEPKIPDNAQTPREVYVHEPDGVQFKSQDRARQPIEQIRLKETTFQYSPDPTQSEIWYMKYWHPRKPLRGLSPVEAAAHSIDINNEGRGWNLSLLQNGAEISGILSFEEGMNEEARNRISQQFKESVEPGDVITADGSRFSFEQLSMSPKDMQWEALSNMSAKEVSITWGVPPEITGFDESKTFCLSGDASVATPKGRSQIKNISEGDRVYSYDTEAQDIVTRSVVWQDQVGEKKTYRVKGRGFCLEATGNHPVLVMGRKKEEGAFASGWRYLPRYEYRRVDDLKKGDIVVKAHTFPDGGLTPTDVPTTNQMEFYGAMIGDGFVGDYDGAYIVSMAGVEGGPRSFYKKMISELSEGRIGEHEREIRVDDKNLVSQLLELGLGGGSKEKRIPSWIFRTPVEHRRAFLRGLWDTDGSVDKKGHVEFRVSNFELAKDVRRLCLSLGIQCTKIRESEREVTLPQGRKADAYLAGFKATVAEHNLPIGSRHRGDSRRLVSGATTSWKGRRMGGCNYAAIQRKMKKAHQGGVEFCSVTSIEEVGVKPVYDIEVEGEHNFFADGVVVHNSNFRTANRVYHQSKIVPLMDFVYGELNSTLVPLFGDDLLLDYDTSGVKALQEEEDALHERLREDVAQGLLTINEARSRIGMDEVSGGDILLIPSTSVPLTAVGSSSASERAAEMMLQEKEGLPEGDGVPTDLVQLESNGKSE